MRTIYVPPGTPVRLREPIKAKIWVFDANGNALESEMIIPEGWYCFYKGKVE